MPDYSTKWMNALTDKYGSNMDQFFNSADRAELLSYSRFKGLGLGHFSNTERVRAILKELKETGRL